jgi:hypothetical protein
VKAASARFSVGKEEMMLKLLAMSFAVGLLVSATVIQAFPDETPRISTIPHIHLIATPIFDPNLPGGRTGVFQQAKGGLIQIDGMKYPLSATPVIRSDSGQAMAAESLERLSGLNLTTQYWFGSGSTGGQIIQMVLTFPR